MGASPAARVHAGGSSSAAEGASEAAPSAVNAHRAALAEDAEVGAWMLAMKKRKKKMAPPASLLADHDEAMYGMGDARMGGAPAGGTVPRTDGDGGAAGGGVDPRARAAACVLQRRARHRWGWMPCEQPCEPCDDEEGCEGDGRGDVPPAAAAAAVTRFAPRPPVVGRSTLGRLTGSSLAELAAGGAAGGRSAGYGWGGKPDYGKQYTERELYKQELLNKTVRAYSLLPRLLPTRGCVLLWPASYSRPVHVLQ